MGWIEGSLISGQPAPNLRSLPLHGVVAAASPSHPGLHRPLLRHPHVRSENVSLHKDWV
jgi:hypothetical protein